MTLNLKEKIFLIFVFLLCATLILLPILLRPVDCKVSQWSQWSNCDKDCGLGKQKRNRTIINKQFRNGLSCPLLEDTRNCSIKPCPQDCVLSDWSEWSPCIGNTCGIINGGNQTRNRNIIRNKIGEGTCTDILEESRKCNTEQCFTELPTSSQMADFFSINIEADKYTTDTSRNSYFYVLNNDVLNSIAIYNGTLVIPLCKTDIKEKILIAVYDNTSNILKIRNTLTKQLPNIQLFLDKAKLDLSFKRTMSLDDQYTIQKTYRQYLNN